MDAALFAFYKVTQNTMRTPEFSIGERLDASFHTRISQNKARVEDGGKKRFTFVISTGAEDRHETIIRPEGGDVRAFMDNPVVLFNHDYDKIVGRALSLEIKGGKIIAQMEFDDDNEFALEKKGQVERGFLNATSIGFMIKSWSVNEDTDQFIIDEWELVEFSIVSVPSNREALVISRDTSGLSELKKEIVQLKDMVAELRQSPVKTVQDARQAEEVESDVAEQEDILIEDSEAPQEEDTESPTEIDVESVSAIHDAEPVQPDEAPSSLEAPRKATAEDYRAIALQMLPLIRKNVRQSLGKE